MILVTGSTGKIGRELVTALLDGDAGGVPVRAATRDPAKARLDPRAEVVTLDLDRPETLPAALDGVERVFVLTAGWAGDGVAQQRRLAEAAAAAGTKHLVKLSTTGVHFGQKDRISRDHARGEEIIRAAGPEWTILRPCAFMANRFAWRRSVVDEDTVYVTEGDPVSALVHPRDVATVAAEVLTSDAHFGRTYPLSGCEGLSPRRQVAILADALGRELTYVEETEAQTRARLVARGWKDEWIDGGFELKRHSAPHERVVFDTVSELLGRAPLTFADWCREVAPLFTA